MPPTKRTKKSKASGEEVKKIADNLQKIYENPDGSMPDMKSFEHGNRGWLRIFLYKFFIFIGLVALGVAVWRFASPRLAYADEVSVAWEGADAVASGEVTTYTIRYRNPDRTPLANARILLEYPRTFTLVSSTPQLGVDNRTIQLGSVAGKTSGQVVISGRWLLDEYATSTITAVLSYTPSNFNATFEKVASKTIAATVSTVSMVWNTSTINVLTPTTFSITVTPKRTLEGPLFFTINQNAGFSFQGSEPKTDQPDIMRWTLPRLASSTTFIIHGVFAENNSAANFSALLSGPTFVYARENTPIITSTTSALAGLSVAGMPDRLSLRPGSIMPISFAFENGLSRAYGNVSAVLYVEAPSYQRKSILDWQNIVDEHDGVIRGEQINESVRRGIIVWDGTQIPALRNIKPGEKPVIKISIPIKKGTTTSLVNFGTSTIKIWGEIKSDGVVIAATNQVVVTILSDLDLKTNVSATETNERFSFLLTNSFHDLKNIKIETNVNGDVAWNPSVLQIPVGTIAFSPENKELRWTITELPTNLDSVELEWGVTVRKKNPSQTEYTGPISVQAIDAETGEPISFMVGPVKVN